MHFGATLRLLRLESGLSLRDLARRLSVSGAYLSRVENGLDSVPTPARLEAIAREFGIAPSLLMGLAQRVSPLVVDYVQEQPSAGALFLEMAHRRLSERQLAEVRAFLDARFPVQGAPQAAPQGISDLLSPERIVLGLTCSSMEDVFDVAVSRFASAIGKSVSSVSGPLKAREGEVSSAIGGGVAVPRAYVDGLDPLAVLVTLAHPLEHNTPDGEPLRTVVLLAAPRYYPQSSVRLAQLARLTAWGLSEQLSTAGSHIEVESRLKAMEALG